MRELRVDTTTATEDEAKLIAAELVERRLAACVQVTGPIQSIYRWNDKVESDTEWRVSIKTTGSQYANVERAIRELHSYDEPQIVGFAIERGSDGYLAWIRAQVDSSESE